MADQNHESQNPHNANQTADPSKAHPDFKQQGQNDDESEKKDVRGSEPADQKNEQNTGTR